MKVVKVIVFAIIMLVSFSMIISLVSKSYLYKKGKLEKINNSVYIIEITILFILFVIYGFLRNFN